MPITRQYSLQELLETCREYPLRARERLTFEYVLLAGVNDTDCDAGRVSRMLAHLKCRVNLIPFNPGEGLPYSAPSLSRVSTIFIVISAS